MSLIKFAISKVELLEEVNNSQFSIAKIDAFASGNNAHNLPVSEEVLKECAETIYDKPLVWIYNSKTDDAGGHHKDEVPCGFVYRQNNPIEFTELDDGRIMLSVKALIWKKYSGKILKFFARDDGEKPVSVEMAVLEPENIKSGQEIKQFCFYAITILGTNVRPAIKSAKAEIIEFSEATKELEGTGFSIDNPDLINNITNKEDDEMAFNRAEFLQQFSITSNELKEMMYNACKGQKYMYGDMERERFSPFDYDDKYMYCYDYQEGNMKAIPYSYKDGKVEADFGIIKNAKMRPCAIDDGESDEVKMSEFAAEITKPDHEKEVNELNAKITEFETKITNLEADKTNLTTQIETEKQEFETQKTTFEAEKTELTKQIQTLTDENTNLKEFKSNIESKEFEDSCMAELNKFKEVFAEKDFNEWSGKIKDFTAVVDFTNALKVFAFDKNVNFSSEEGYIALPKNGKTDNKPKSVWDRI